MNKKELINEVAKLTADISQKDVQTIIDATLLAISNSLAKGNKVTIVGFGTFSIRARKAREGRNPRTGARIGITADKYPAFSAGKSLKKRIQDETDIPPVRRK